MAKTVISVQLQTVILRVSSGSNTIVTHIQEWQMQFADNLNLLASFKSSKLFQHPCSIPSLAESSEAVPCNSVELKGWSSSVLMIPSLESSSPQSKRGLDSPFMFHRWNSSLLGSLFSLAFASDFWSIWLLPRSSWYSLASTLAKDSKVLTWWPGDFTATVSTSTSLFEQEDLFSWSSWLSKSESYLLSVVGIDFSRRIPCAGVDRWGKLPKPSIPLDNLLACFLSSFRRVTSSSRFTILSDFFLTVRPQLNLQTSKCTHFVLQDPCQEEEN